MIPTLSPRLPTYHIISPYSITFLASSFDKQLKELTNFNLPFYYKIFNDSHFFLLSNFPFQILIKIFKFSWWYSIMSDYLIRRICWDLRVCVLIFTRFHQKNLVDVVKIDLMALKSEFLLAWLNFVLFICWILKNIFWIRP